MKSFAFPSVIFLVFGSIIQVQCLKFGLPRLVRISNDVRSALGKTILSIAIPFALLSAPELSLASTGDIVSTQKDVQKDVPLYFGVGCFWHVQHEFVAAEKTVLGRTDDQLTV